MSDRSCPYCRRDSEDDLIGRIREADNAVSSFGSLPQRVVLTVTMTDAERRLAVNEHEFVEYKHRIALQELGLALMRYLEHRCQGTPVLVVYNRRPWQRGLVPEVHERLVIELSEASDDRARA